MQNYINLLKEIKEIGVFKPSRAGDTISVFGRQLRWNMNDGFPLMTIKKTSFHNIAHELLWFLGAFDDEWKKFGNTNIRYLVDHNVNIWNGDAYRAYVIDMGRGKHDGYFSKDEFVDEIKNDDDFALQWGELGDAYGAQWRRWKVYDFILDSFTSSGIQEMEPIDQIQKVIDQLKETPLSRRHIVTAWNPEVVDALVLAPCHYGFTLNAEPLSKQDLEDLIGKEIQIPVSLNGANDINTWRKEKASHLPKYKLNLKWNQRSVDTVLGLPYNIASYGLLLKMLAHLTNMIPNEVIGSLEDTHIYTNQMGAVDALIGREEVQPPLPELELVNLDKVHSIDDFRIENFKIIDYKPLSKVNAPLSVGL